MHRARGGFGEGAGRVREGCGTAALALAAQMSDGAALERLSNGFRTALERLSNGSRTALWRLSDGSVTAL
jgi:hypothetical protein